MRKVLFWLHLISGCVAGIIILLMSVTGVLLTYEQQMIRWFDRAALAAPAPGNSQPLKPEALLEKIREQRGALPSALTIRRDTDAPVEATFGRDGFLYADRATGASLGEGNKAAREWFHTITSWHRWLGVEGPGRLTARLITGVCNLAFLFLVLSGLILWFPRKWTWQHFRPILWFRGGLDGKARDFNWHNVWGFWCLVPLFFIVISGAVISFPWASNLVYTLTGTQAPSGPGGGRPSGGGPPEGRPGRAERPVSLTGLDAAFVRSQQVRADWRSITLRIPPSPRAPFSLTVDSGDNRGRVDLRTQVTIARGDAGVIRAEGFESFNTGRKARTWLRFIHTGEAGGLAGQTLAGLASAGGGVLVWTGFSLAWHRFRKWQARRSKRTLRRKVPTAAEAEPDQAELRT